MKRILFIISLMFMSSLLLVAQEERKVKSNAEMAFESLSHDYGSLAYAANGAYDFKFTNNSKKPIVITNVKSSCGCTVPSWPKEPIQPGENGKITVKYNTKLAGSFNKTVQVFSTAENSPVKLSIRGKVTAKPSEINSANKNSKLQNGTRIKPGVGGAEISRASQEELNRKEMQQGNPRTSAEKMAREKEAKRQAYLKKLEAQKKIKK